MSEPAIAAIVYSDGVYPDGIIARAIEPLRAAGLPLAGALQVEPLAAGRHRCDMLLEELASGEVHAIAEYRGREARGCRLDVSRLTEIGEAVLHSLRDDRPRLLVVNKFGKIEADGGGLRHAVAEAVDLGIPALIGVPARNLDRWHAFVGSLAVELPASVGAVADWLAGHGLPSATGGLEAAAPARAA
jgi:nucleoside-triphosphatase THEP1